MTSAGPNFPTVGGNDASIGSVTWANPGQITAADGLYASAAYGTSHYLAGSSFGFAIPAGMTINGILLEVNQSSSAAYSTENSVRLSLGGSLVGTDKSTGATIPHSGSVWVSYGGSADTWGIAAGTLTPANLNASTFAALWSAVNGTGTIYVDAFRVTGPRTP